MEHALWLRCYMILIDINDPGIRPDTKQFSWKNVYHNIHYKNFIESRKYKREFMKEAFYLQGGSDYASF